MKIVFRDVIIPINIILSQKIFRLCMFRIYHEFSIGIITGYYFLQSVRSQGCMFLVKAEIDGL